MAPDLRFWFDPVCPYAWITSKWVRTVAEQRHYRVEWCLVSLRMLNPDDSYDPAKPAHKASHESGLGLLRVAARARAELGPDAVGALYEQMGTHLFECTPQERAAAGADGPGTALKIVAAAGLPAGLAGALGDTSWDAEIRRETDEAIALAGKDLGTPVLHFEPPDGLAFFGPVISRVPDEEEAGQLWEHVVALSRFPGFAELKRSLREVPQLPVYGA